MAHISTHKGATVNTEHNERTEGVVKKEKHIRAEGERYTDTLGRERIAHSEILRSIPVREACEQIFGEALRAYNEKQGEKHKERQIKDYIKHIEDKPKQHFVYEMIYGVYETEGEKIAPETKYEIYRKITEDFEKRNPNMKVIGAYLHDDENAGAHLQLDYIPVGYNNKNGLSVQCSQNKALAEMGYTLQKANKETGEKSKYAITQWQDSERAYLKELCNERGINVEFTGEKRKHEADKELFILQRKLEEAKKELNGKDKVIVAKNSQIEKLTKKIQEQKDYEKLGRKKVKVTKRDYIDRGLDREHIDKDKAELKKERDRLADVAEELREKKRSIEFREKELDQKLADSREVLDNVDRFKTSVMEKAKREAREEVKSKVNSLESLIERHEDFLQKYNINGTPMLDIFKQEERGRVKGDYSMVR